MTQPSTPITPRKIHILIDGVPREFILRQGASPALLGFLEQNWNAAKEAFRLEDGSINVHTIRKVFFSGPDATEELCKMAFKGDHTDIDWYYDSDLVGVINYIAEYLQSAMSPEFLDRLRSAQMSGGQSAP